jgi:hypothetical protein
MISGSRARAGSFFALLDGGEAGFHPLVLDASAKIRRPAEAASV